jgi:hypothetical protein
MANPGRTAMGAIFDTGIAEYTFFNVIGHIAVL